MGSPSHNINEAMQSDIQSLRVEMNNLFISDGVVTNNEAEIHPTTPRVRYPTFPDIVNCPVFEDTMSYRVKLPIFRGPDFQQAPMFIKNLEDFFKSAHIPVKDQLKVVKSLLFDSAVQWKVLNEDKWQYYNDFRRHFLHTFWSANIQSKERTRLSERRFASFAGKHCLTNFFLRTVNKYRFFMPPLSEHEILLEVMGMYPGDIENKWLMENHKTFETTLSFLQRKESLESSSSNIHSLTRVMDDLCISDNLTLCSTPPNIQNMQNSGSKERHVKYIYDKIVNPPIYHENKCPVKFIKDLEDYFSYAMVPVKDQLTAAINCLFGPAIEWVNNKKMNWNCFDDFRQDFLSTFWSRDRQSEEWEKLREVKFTPEEYTSMVDFFYSMVYRYSLFTPPLGEKIILMEIVSKYPEQTSSLWSDSLCFTLASTLSFLQKQDRIEYSRKMYSLFKPLAKHSIAEKPFPTLRDSLIKTKQTESPRPWEQKVSDWFESANVVKIQKIAPSDVPIIEIEVNAPVFQDRKSSNPAWFIKDLEESFLLTQTPIQNQLSLAKSLMDGAIEWRNFHEANWKDFADFRQDFLSTFWSDEIQFYFRENLKQKKFSQRWTSMIEHFLSVASDYCSLTVPYDKRDMMEEIMFLYPDSLRYIWMKNKIESLDAAFFFLEREQHGNHSWMKQSKECKQRCRATFVPYIRRNSSTSTNSSTAHSSRRVKVFLQSCRCATSCLNHM